MTLYIGENLKKYLYRLLQKLDIFPDKSLGHIFLLLFENFFHVRGVPNFFHTHKLVGGYAEILRKTGKILPSVEKLSITRLLP